MSQRQQRFKNPFSYTNKDGHKNTFKRYYEFNPLTWKNVFTQLTTSWHLSAAFLAKKNKFDQEIFYANETIEQVPEKPLQTHCNKPSSIISGSSIETMGIFPSRKNSWTLCELKLIGAS
jgi:hypothetical protein